VSSDHTDQLVEIGVVGRPHSIRGEMRVFLHNPKSEHFGSLKTILIKVDVEVRPYAVKNIRRASDHYLLALKDVTTREQAQQFKGGVVYVARNSLPEPDADEFYVDDLVGLEAWDGDELLGKISFSREAGGIEVVNVRGEDHEMEIPLVEDFVIELDIKGGRVLFCDTDILPRNKLGNRHRRR
jgi:16S rRNA processing protein RimM